MSFDEEYLPCAGCHEYERERQELQAEIERLRAYEQELADAASVLQSALPVGEVKAIGLREVAAGCRQLVSEVGRLRVDNEKLAKQVGEWIENFPEAGGEE